MFTKQLYRYLNNDWISLSDAERATAKAFLKQHDPYKTLRKIPNGETLYSLVFGKKNTRSRPHLFEYQPEDASVAARFEIHDKSRGYFRNVDKSALFSTYKALNVLFERIEKLSGTARFGTINAAAAAYTFMVLFGGELSIEDALTAFDAHCITNDISHPGKILAVLSNISLPKVGEQASIDLPAWRAIIRNSGLQQTLPLPLFERASDIEAALGRAPINFQEALATAHAFQFAKASQCPELAGLCVVNLVPESFFNRCLSDDLSVRKQARIGLMHKLPEALRADFVRVVPVEDMDLIGLADFLRSLSGDAQSAFMTRFRGNICSLVKSRADFFRILSPCTHPAARVQLLSLVTEFHISFQIAEFSDLISLLSPLDAASRVEWLPNLVDPGELEVLITSTSDLNKFLTSIMPTDRPQVPWLIETIGAEKIRSLTENHIHVVNQLEHIKPKAQLNYINTILGANKIKAVIGDNWCMLERVLKALRKEDILPFLFEILGLETLRPMLLHRGDKRPVDAVLSVLKREQRDEFMALIIPEEEKHAETRIMATRQRIIDTAFDLGWGGTDITLDDGRIKAVPATVAQQWTHIQNARKTWLGNAEAWKQVRELGVNAKTNAGLLTMWTRGTSTSEYYSSFLDDKAAAVRFHPQP